MESLEDLKTQLKATLMSNPERMTVSDLWRDYREMNGRPFPVAAFGCSSFEIFVKTHCEDIFKFDRNAPNCVLHPILSDKSSNINELIMKQRATAKPRFRGRGKRCLGVAPSTRSTRYVAPSQNFPTHRPTANANPAPKSSSSYVAPPRFAQTKTSDVVAPLSESQTSTASAAAPQKKASIRANPKLAQGADSWQTFQSKRSPKKVAEEDESESTTARDIETKKGSVERFLDEGDRWRPIPRAESSQNELKEDSPSLSPTSANESSDFEEALPFIAPVGFPDDCVDFNEAFKRPPPLTKGSLHSVYLSHVTDPSHFWFQIYTSESEQTAYGCALARLMNDLNYLYYKQPLNFNLPLEYVRVGQVCAAPFGDDKSYHRALIVQEASRKTVKVNYVDYGTTALVCTTDLKYLRKDHFRLPVQAFRGRLKDSFPKNTKKWSYDATQFFLKTVANVKLFAEVTHVEEKEDVYHLQLVDTSVADKDVYMNRLLHNEGWSNYKCLMPNPACYEPSFYKLETGELGYVLTNEDSNDNNFNSATNTKTDSYITSCEKFDTKLYDKTEDCFSNIASKVPNDSYKNDLSGNKNLKLNNVTAESSIIKETVEGMNNLSLNRSFNERFSQNYRNPSPPKLNNATNFISNATAQLIGLEYIWLNNLEIWLVNFNQECLPMVLIEQALYIHGDKLKWANIYEEEFAILTSDVNTNITTKCACEFPRKHILAKNLISQHATGFNLQNKVDINVSNVSDSSDRKHRFISLKCFCHILWKHRNETDVSSTLLHNTTLNLQKKYKNHKPSNIS